MSKIIKNLRPYWKTVIIIIALLLVQAWSDLSLPQYTSNIIDTGIQNSGIEHVVPEAITAKEYDIAKLFMTEEEIKAWEASYDQDGDIYRLNVIDKEQLNELDELLSMALIMNYQMAAVEEAVFREMIASQMGVDVSSLNNLTLEDLGTQLGMTLQTFTREEENEDGDIVTVTCIDVREVFKSMFDARAMSKDDILVIRDGIEESFDVMGSSFIKSVGVAYAIARNKEAGINVSSIQTAYLWNAGLRMIGMALLMGVTVVLVGFFAAKVGAGVGRDLRENVFKKVVGFSNTEMDQFSTASLITRSTNDVQQIQMVTAMLLRMIAYAPILGLGGILKVSENRVGMGWVIGLAVLVLLGFISLLMSIAMPKFKLMQKLVDRVNLVSREILTGLSVIRAFGREQVEENRFDDANKDLTKTMLFTNRVMTFMMPGMTIIMNGLSILIVWVGAHKISDGVMQVGALTAFITYSMMIVMSFLMLSMLSIMLPRAAVAAERIDEVLRKEYTIKEEENPEKLTSHKGVLEFKNVNFRYPGAEEDVLENINFIAEPGKTTAMIGSTGSGKTTLVNLIPRLYDVTSGVVTLDGKDIRKISMQELRSEIGYVPQKGILFSGTIASNLRFGNEKATEEELKEAATIAQASEFIDAKENKYESEIAQGGSNVSGGQKQRLSIARAIVKNPRVFVFDDSFSALDLKTDAALRKALNKKVKEKTVIIVAQRISTILHADQIIVLDNGKIVGKGKHEELLRNCEVYQQIASSQLSAKELGLDEEGKEEISHE